MSFSFKNCTGEYRGYPKANRLCDEWQFSYLFSCSLRVNYQATKRHRHFTHYWVIALFTFLKNQESQALWSEAFLVWLAHKLISYVFPRFLSAFINVHFARLCSLWFCDFTFYKMNRLTTWVCKREHAVTCFSPFACLFPKYAVQLNEGWSC